MWYALKAGTYDGRPVQPGNPVPELGDAQNGATRRRASQGRTKPFDVDDLIGRICQLLEVELASAK